MTSIPVSSASSTPQILKKATLGEKWLAAAELLIQVAIRAIFIAAQILMAAYFLPAAWHWIAIPLVAIEATVLSIFFFPGRIFAGPGEDIFPLITPVAYHPSHYPEKSPVGYWNREFDCSINATLHLLDSDPQVRDWMRNTKVDSLDDFLRAASEYGLSEECCEEFRGYIEVNKEGTLLESFLNFEPKEPLECLRGVKRQMRELSSILPALREFYEKNDVAVENRRAVSSGSSAKVRQTLSKHVDISLESNQQEDANEIAMGVLGLLPPRMRMQYEAVKMLDDAIISTKEMVSPLIPLEINPKNPTLEHSLEEFYESATENGAFNKEQNRFTVAPPALRFQLKRFTQDGAKLDFSMTIPEKLPIKLKDGRELNYRLVGFVSHCGKTTEDGHYTAAEIRGKDKFLENDHRVTLVESEKDQAEWGQRLEGAYLVWYLPEEPLPI